MQRTLAVFLCVILSASPAWATGGSNSGDSSNGSNSSADGGSSKGSADSSNASGNSSQNSNDSSADSSNRSSNGTSEESTRSDGGVGTTVALYVVVGGALVAGGIVGLVLSTRRGDDDEAEQARHAAREQQVLSFLERYHGGVVRDFALGQGPLLDSWARAWRLSPQEYAALRHTVRRQPSILASVNGPLTPRHARAFCSEVYRALQSALGVERAREIAATAANS